MHGRQWENQSVTQETCNAEKLSWKANQLQPVPTPSAIKGEKSLINSKGQSPWPGSTQAL